ncbi:MAG: hypothetical protein HOP18_08540 [Deltaproteobacteria bacterium]|nr:hypothetical protein [Deltaproteobacteria bacterium]
MGRVASWQFVVFTCLLAFLTSLSQGVSIAVAALSYDVVYVRQLRFGDNTSTTWPEVFHPALIDAGADLMLLHPNGTEEVLVDCSVCSVTDPFVSFDAQWVYYSLFHNPSNLNTQRNLPYAGADIYRIHLSTRRIQRLTFGEFTPNTGTGVWLESNPVNPPNTYNSLGYGILNLGPAPVAGGKIMFTSNRNGFIPPKGFTNPTLQLFVMDEDGSNVTPIAPMTISSALHPTPLRDGRLMFSSHEGQGLRDVRLWGIWSINPDGRNWGPVVSAFRSPQAFHFMTQLSNEDIIVTDYYNLNNNGFGALYRFPVRTPAGVPPFHSAFPAQNPAINQTVGQGFLYPFKMPFTPRGMYSITPFTHGEDHAAPVLGSGGVRVGKFTQPSAAPNNDLLVVWTPGPANDLNRPTPLPYYNAGIYLVPGGNILTSPAGLVLLKNDPLYNEAWPRAVVPYSAVHGVAQPVKLPWLPNNGTVHAALPKGTPYGLVGTSSFYKRESFPGFTTTAAYNGLDVFNTSQNDHNSNWSWQGSDAGKYSNADIWAVRVLAMEPNTHRSYGPNTTCCGPGGANWFYSHAMERLRILGEIPLRKFNTDGSPVLDPQGNPDTSFLAKLPADTPFTFQTLDRNGMVLNMAQTWHQVRPGEARYDCGGCHAHSQQPLDFHTTAASKPGYQIVDLSKVTPLVTHDALGKPAPRTVAAPVVNVEFYKDIRPLLQRSCVPCHTKNNPTPPGKLVLDDRAIDSVEGLPGDYVRLAKDDGARFGYPSLVTYAGQSLWRQTNASRYIRMFQSRRSLLTWKIFGRRLDGWTNANHPTETVPGNVATLPAGADANLADIDFTGTIMPPPNSGVPPLTVDEKMTFARWIDLGCPINFGQESGNGAWGWFMDEIRPTLTVSSPGPGLNPTAVSEIRFGTADAYTGVNSASLIVRATFPVAGRAPWSELRDLVTQVGDGIYSLPVSPALTIAQDARVYVAIADKQRNYTRVNREFSVGTVTGNTPPVLALIGAKTATVGRLLTFTISATDANAGSVLTYAAAGLPSGTTFDKTTRTFRWTPLAAQVGRYAVTFSVSDGKATDMESVVVTVN